MLSLTQMLASTTFQKMTKCNTFKKCNFGFKWIFECISLALSFSFSSCLCTRIFFQENYSHLSSSVYRIPRGFLLLPNATEAKLIEQRNKTDVEKPSLRMLLWTKEVYSLEPLFHGKVALESAYFQNSSYPEDCFLRFHLYPAPILRYSSEKSCVCTYPNTTVTSDHPSFWMLIVFIIQSSVNLYKIQTCEKLLSGSLCSFTSVCLWMLTSEAG